MKHLILSLLFILGMVACTDQLPLEPPTPPTGQGQPGLSIGVQLPATANVDPLTRAENQWGALASSNGLNTLLMLVVKHNPNAAGTDDDCRVVAYRLLIRKKLPDPTDPTVKYGDKYLFYNNNNNNNNNNFPPELGPVRWPAVRLGDIGGQHRVAAEEGDEGAYYDVSEGWVRGVDDSEFGTQDPESRPGVYLEGYNEWQSGDVMNKPRTTAKFNFYYFHPLHGDFERPLPGEYGIAFIANFTDGDDKVMVPYPDPQMVPLGTESVTIDAPMKGGGTTPITLPVMSHPGMPIGYHVKELLAYWQRHKDDPDFDGIPMAPCYDDGACGPIGGMPSSPVDGYGGGLVENDWFVGARCLLTGRIVYDDAHVVTSPAGLDTYGFRTASALDQILSNTFLWNRAETQIYTKYVDVELTHGENDLSTITMDRITARTTITLHNMSNKVVRVTGLSLSDNYAQAATTLFMGGGDGHHFGNPLGYSSNWRGRPDLTSTRAIVPFKPGTAALNEDEAWADNADQRDRVIFDGLTYGAQDLDNPMKCRIQVEMDGMTGTSTELHTTPITLEEMNAQLASVEWLSGTSKKYLMQNQRQATSLSSYGDYSGIKSFMRGGDGVRNWPWADHTRRDISDFTGPGVGGVDDCFQWNVEKVDNTHVRLQISKSGMYLRAESYNQSTGSPWGLTNVKDDATQFVLGKTAGHEGGGNGFYFQWATGVRLRMFGNTLKGFLGDEDLNSCRFQIFPLTTNGAQYAYAKNAHKTYHLSNDLNASSWANREQRYVALQPSIGNNDLRTNGEGEPSASANEVNPNQNKGNVSLPYVWAIEKVSTTHFKIYSVQEGKYIQLTNPDITGASITLTTNANDATQFQCSSSANPTGFFFDAFIYPHLLAKPGHPLHGEMVAMGNWNDEGCHFELYEVEEVTGNNVTKAKEHEFVINRMKLTDAHAQPMHSYKRGDHLNIDISVDYNPVTSQILFGVTNWGEKNSEIDYE